SISTPGPGASDPIRDRTPAASQQVDADYSRLEEKLSSLAAAVNHWQRDLENSASRASRLEGAFTVLLSSLEGWKSDIREVASRTESRVLRGLEVIDSRISRVQPGGSPLEHNEILAAIQGLERAFGERIALLEGDISAVRTAARSTEGMDTLDRRLESIEMKVSASDTEMSGRLGASFEILERRLSSIEQRMSAPDTELTRRLAASFEVLERRLQSIEEKVTEPDTGLSAGLTEGFAVLQRAVSEGQDRITEALAQAAAPQSTELLVQNLRMLEGRLAESQQVLSRKLEAARAETDVTSANQLRQLAALQEQQAAFGKRLETVAERASAPIDPEQIQRLAEGQQRLLEAVTSSNESDELNSLTASLRDLQNKVEQGQTALTAKMETVLAEGDENSATQLRYLGSLEELQAAVAKRLNALEAIVKNPLDAQQWERLAKGLEFLDVRLAQSLESVSTRIDKAVGGLTATLDARAAAGQDANIKSAERLWRALRGLEDQITGSYQMVRSSQERLEASTVNVGSALEELRAVHGARAGHTEKLLMEGLENLDGRFAQNLMTISERLNSAIFALNKSTEEWRSDLANSSEEAEERMTTRVAQAEAKLAAEIRAGLEALGRREERMLALILGGGPAVLSSSDEAPVTPE
ncbi:MAG TPA: hypothetical protein VHI31_07740, partial [Actinomycetota bacterium]|nr:hypothetical protein [Actinomycetota bacterium]